MGQSISNSMKENQKEMQKEMQKKQLELILKQRQTQLAIQFASGKEFFHWYASFYCLIFPFCVIGAIKKKVHFDIIQNPLPVVVLVPLGFVCAYQYDMFYGDKMKRIKLEAERLIEQESQLFYFPKNAKIVSQEEYESILEIKKIGN
ncbi:unnamed protein product (macronuclear) [Paramecium tetraurelia]|uniref:Plasminogen receptor (KT) n=1 Tax=Paramecium tetraurelia TaxID=5888 RepID=A0C599_PARTE|nr:uncharacterized protein GSPATT00006465001 [Paramecium tetraurelia]CAK65966.1 unnamed protein product [Paramecium tetraurelia]|eukprot:XP_001433363.1 hypothetical protein (macronuclear) [Paramecium tetraurelia strain d4-2]